jgi:hypothetical protein
LKRYKWPGTDQILAELIKAGSEILLSEIHKLINSVWNKEEFPDQWKECTGVSIISGTGAAISTAFLLARCNGR